MKLISPTEANSVLALKCPQCGANIPPNAEDYIVCQYCGTSLLLTKRVAESGETEEMVVRGMHLKPFTCSDPEGTGLDVFRMDVPVGWKFQGGCRWLLNNPGMPATVAFQISNPQGAEMFEVLPTMNFTWNNNPMTRIMFPVGSRYFGAEVRQPMGIQQALRALALPRYRGAVQNLQIVKEEPQPDLPRLVRSEAALTGGSAEGGKLRVRYALQGIQYEEDIYGVVELYRAPTVSIWFLGPLSAFRTAAGRLDDTSNLFKVMTGSLHVNPNWSAACKSIVQYLAQRQIQQIHHIGQIGEMMARTGREIRQQNLNDWYSRQATHDRVSTEWSRTIRDMDAFVNPHTQEEVEVPSAYGHAWVSDLGDYYATDDPNINPNLFSNQHWEQMEKK